MLIPYPRGSWGIGRRREIRKKKVGPGSSREEITPVTREGGAWVIRDKGKDPSTLPSVRPSAADRRRGETVRRGSSRAWFRPATSHPVPKTQLWGREVEWTKACAFPLPPDPAQLASQKCLQGFPGGAVDKSPPANAGDTGSIPSPGRSYMPRGN